MKTLTMPELSTKTRKGQTLRIRGGWALRLPQINSLDSETLGLYSRFFKHFYGLNDIQAEAETLKRMNTLFEASWSRHFTASVRRWARKYAERFPSCINPDGTLHGFDPEQLQNIYIPGELTGRRGKKSIGELFRKFASAPRRSDASV